jgi:hypothetical protein
MLIIQHNCRKASAITIAALETGIKRNAAFICLQEPYVGQIPISHPGYTLYWPETGKQNEKRVSIAVKRDIMAQIIIEARTDLINHPYTLVLDIWDIQPVIKTKKRRTRLINVYDNRIGLGTCYKGDAERTWRAIEDIQWQPLLRGRAVLLGDFNAQSPIWDPFITQRKEAGPLETIIEDFDLILNNEQGAITRPGNKTKGSIIDLTFTTTELGPLDLWVIDEDDPTPSDHALILMEWADINETCITYKGKQKGEITGWNIDMLKEDPEALEKAKEEYLSRAIYQPKIDYNSQQKDLENKVA